MKKTIAIIGAAGNMGSGITRKLAKAEYPILIAGRDKEKLSNLLISIKTSTPNANVEILNCTKEASWEADVIIPAVSYQAQAEVVSKIKDVVTGKIVISIANPLNETYDGLVTNPTTSAAEELALLLPHSKVVKAFNTVSAATFDSPVLDGKTIDAFIAGNDDVALSVVSAIVRDAGFNPLIAGNLSMSRTLENMALILISLALKNNSNWLTGWKILH